MESKTFPVVILSREDIAEAGYNHENITDAQLEYIAQEISEACMPMYWDMINHIMERDEKTLSSRIATK